MTPSLTCLTLYCLDLEATRTFYERTCGFAFVPERHGTGPLHYSTNAGGVTLELYPTRMSRPPRLTVRASFKAGAAYDPDGVTVAHEDLDT